jgi:hypothetical protein
MGTFATTSASLSPSSVSSAATTAVSASNGSSASGVPKTISLPRSGSTSSSYERPTARAGAKGPLDAAAEDHAADRSVELFDVLALEVGRDEDDEPGVRRKVRERLARVPGRLAASFLARSAAAEARECGERGENDERAHLTGV